MERRRFIAASVALLVAPVASGAQQPVKVYRPGVLTPVRAAIFMTPFVDSPRDLGWIERRTFTLEYRLSGDTPGGADEAARDLVAQRVDMIVTLVTGNAVAAKRATNEIAYAGAGVFGKHVEMLKALLPACDGSRCSGDTSRRSFTPVRTNSR